MLASFSGASTVAPAGASSGAVRGLADKDVGKDEAGRPASADRQLEGYRLVVVGCHCGLSFVGVSCVVVCWFVWEGVFGSVIGR